MNDKKFFIINGNEIVEVQRLSKKLFADASGVQYIRAEKNVFATRIEAEEGLQKLLNDRRSRAIANEKEEQKALAMYDAFIEKHWDIFQDRGSMLGINPTEIFKQ